MCVPSEIQVVPACPSAGFFFFFPILSILEEHVSVKCHGANQPELGV